VVFRVHWITVSIPHLRDLEEIMPKFTIGQSLIIDKLQRKLDEIEKTWPMTAGYQRIDPYIVPYLQAGDYYELIIYHAESKDWFDNTNFDPLVNMIVGRKMVAEGDVVFDLGCNAGAVTVVLAGLAGETGKVHAFDPYPWNAAATQFNCELNYFRNVVTYAVGLSNKAYRIKVRPDDSRTYAAEDNMPDSQELVIDSINSHMQLAPTFMKIDIEGAEYDLFQDQTATTFGSVKQFALEFHPMWIRPRGLDPKNALYSIESAGFTLHYYSPESAPYQVSTYSDDHHLFWGRRTK
jgi:FkbM family methyltransferase